MKNVILLIAISACIFLGIKVSDAWKERDDFKSRYQQLLEKKVDEPLPIIERIVDTVYQTSTAIVAPVTTPGNVSDYVSKSLADSMARQLKIKDNKIEQLISLKLSLEDTLQGFREKDDKGIEWLYTADDVFNIRANLHTDSIHASAKIGVDIMGGYYRKNIFSKWEYRTAIRARDHRVDISDVRQVIKVKNPSKFGIGVTAGPTFTTNGMNYGITAGINYQVIGF